MHTHTHHAAHEAQIGKSHSVRDFVPLIVIFALIVIATWLVVARVGSYDLFTALRNFMGIFFLVFGAFKVLNLKGFADAYQIYDILAMRSRVYAYFYPFIELALGLAYFFSFWLLITNWATLVLMLTGAYGVYLKLREKEVVPCACLGTVFKIPMTWVTLGEDLLMASMALGMIILLS